VLADFQVAEGLHFQLNPLTRVWVRRKVQKGDIYLQIMQSMILLLTGESSTMLHHKLIGIQNLPKNLLLDKLASDPSHTNSGKENKAHIYPMEYLQEELVHLFEYLGIRLASSSL
jgi:hypothetical protein